MRKTGRTLGNSETCNAHAVFAELFSLVTDVLMAEWRDSGFDRAVPERF